MRTEQQHVGSEAVIWAAGTQYTSDELTRLYREHCEAREAAGEEPLDCQRFFNRELGIANN
jgi:hypothetical protein